MKLIFNEHENFIKESYIELINRYKHLSMLISVLNDKNNLYIFGGWLRDILHNYYHNDNVSWQDIDIVVDGQITEKNLPAFTRSNFGGYRFNFARDRKADFWELKETFAFKQNILSASSENIIKTTVFAMNGLLFDIKKYKLTGLKSIEDIKKKLIKFNCKDYLYYFPELQVFRAFLYSEKLGYEIDGEIIEFAKEILQNRSEIEFFDLILKHKSWVSLEEVELLFTFFKNL
ncbi:hypothetical protein [uncultured Desulfosarcina sp.]|uniref:hypothetical protein n=1 Tax=uncultured Desulfosarcina sp. TaxID=218289 RepID=UPI0029C99598|nr:hypothetical protein [uncultured Desulfosarcina sp.]